MPHPHAHTPTHLQAAAPQTGKSFRWQENKSKLSYHWKLKNEAGGGAGGQLLMALFVVWEVAWVGGRSVAHCRCNQVKEIIYSLDYNFISGNTKASSQACRRQELSLSLSLCCGCLSPGMLRWLSASSGAASCLSMAGNRALYIYWLLWQRERRRRRERRPSLSVKSLPGAAARQKSIVPIIIMRLLTYWTTKRRSQH